MKKPINNEPTYSQDPAISLEEREKQMVSLAVDLAEKQLIEGTASPSVITHYLKLGSTRDRAEKEKLETENALLKAKIEAIQRNVRIEDMFADAIKAFRGYQGIEEGDDIYVNDQDLF